MKGEVPLDEIRAQLRAGRVAYEDFLATDDLRRDLAVHRIEAGHASPAETSQLLCAWCAWVLQSLAEAFVGADQQVSPTTAGFLPRITATQVSLLAREVPVWSGRARRAAVDPGYDVAAEVALPANFDGWVAAEPCPPAHLAAMRAATVTMVERLETMLADTADAPSTVGGQLRGLITEVQARFASVPAVSSGRASPANHEAEEAILRDGVQRCYVLGQILARPQLLTRPTRPAGAPPPWAPPGFGPPAYGHGHHGHHHD